MPCLPKAASFFWTSPRHITSEEGKKSRRTISHARGNSSQVWSSEISPRRHRRCFRHHERLMRREISQVAEVFNRRYGSGHVLPVTSAWFLEVESIDQDPLTRTSLHTRAILSPVICIASTSSSLRIAVFDFNGYWAKEASSRAQVRHVVGVHVIRRQPPVKPSHLVSRRRTASFNHRYQLFGCLIPSFRFAAGSVTAFKVADASL